MFFKKVFNFAWKCKLKSKVKMWCLHLKPKFDVHVFIWRRSSSAFASVVVASDITHSLPHYGMTVHPRPSHHPHFPLPFTQSLLEPQPPPPYHPSCHPHSGCIYCQPSLRPKSLPRLFFLSFFIIFNILNRNPIQY